MIDTKKYFLTSDYQRFTKEFGRYMRSLNDKHTHKKAYSVRFGDNIFVGFKGKTTWATRNNAISAVANAISEYTKSWDAACNYIDELIKNGEMVIKEIEIVD